MITARSKQLSYGLRTYAHLLLPRCGCKRRGTRSAAPRAYRDRIDVIDLHLFLACRAHQQWRNNISHNTQRGKRRRKRIISRAPAT